MALAGRQASTGSPYRQTYHHRSPAGCDRQIIRDLALGREGSLSVEHTRGSPPAHGVQRYHDGLDVGEVVAEYNLLRVAFITVAERHDLLIVGDAARIINRWIDEAVRLAVMAFAAQHALILREREDEHLAFIAHDLRTPLYAASLLIGATFSFTIPTLAGVD